METLRRIDFLPLIKAALKEDVGSGDVTSLATVPKRAQATAYMVARESLTVAGLAVAEAVFHAVSPALRVKLQARDGKRLKAGDPLMTITGSAQAILTAERTALNFIQRLSGVATITTRFVDEVKGTTTRILDTRKTTPGWRRLEKYAVACGGGTNHRTGLFDMVLIKDNHLAAIYDAKPSAVAVAIQQARKKYPKLKVEVEADTLEQVEQGLAAKADFILLDNMSNAQLRKAVKMTRDRAKTEASGGVNLKTVRGIAKTGVDFISVGALTHSARAVDIALDFEHSVQL